MDRLGDLTPRRPVVPAPLATQVKICGVNSRAAYLAARDSGADYVGLVFFPRSPRYVRAEQAAGIVGGDDGPPRVGLFVEPSLATIADILAVLRLDALQIYASADRAVRLGATLGLPVWLPVGVSQPSDLPTEANGADRLLIEPRAPRNATRPGGNAATMNWAMLSDWDAPAPWFLAGGLDAGNVAAAIAASRAAGVDVSSGTETSPGVKSAAEIDRFVRNAKASH